MAPEKLFLLLINREISDTQHFCMFDCGSPDFAKLIGGQWTDQADCSFIFKF